MRSILLLALGAPLLCACATSKAPTTSWGKEGVSMLDYRVDGAQCAMSATTVQAGGNQANTAGGVTGNNGGGSQLPNVDYSRSAGTAVPTGGGVYRDSAPADVVNRAAMAQRAREIEEQRVRTEALKSCLVERGYREFTLTAEQRKHLATLPEGSDARREYLYKLGTDPQVLAGARKSGS